MANDAAELLIRPRHKSRHVHKRDERYVESVAEPDEPRPLDARIYVERTGQDRGLVPHHPYGVAVESGEANDEVLGPAFLHLEEFPVVHRHLYRSTHVVGPLGRVRYEGGKLTLHTFRIVGRPVVRGALQVVLRQKGEEVTHVSEAALLVGGREVGDPAGGVVGARAPELLLRYLFA